MAPTQNWSHEEDKALCHAFLHVSQDGAIGTGQEKGTYWYRIQQYMYQVIDTRASPGGKQRTTDALQGRWKKHIWEKCSNWNRALQQAQRTCATGTNLIDEAMLAETIYYDDNKKCHFTFKHCFPIIEDYVALHPSPDTIRKYNLKEPIAPSHEPTPDPSMPYSQPWETQTDTPFTTNLQSDFEYPTPSPTLNNDNARASGSRPPGRAHAKGKGKVNQPSPVADLVEQMKQTREANDMIAVAAQRRHDEVQETKNRFLKLKEDENETYIMSMDTTQLTPGQKEHFAAKRQAIRARRNLFPATPEFPTSGYLPPY